MKECKYCRTQYDDNLTVCPNCGGSKIVTEDEIAEEKAYKELEADYREKANAAPELHKKRIIGGLIGVITVVIITIAVASAISNSPLSNGMTKDEGKSVLATGKEYLENGEYEKALEYFLQLPTDSKQYSEAQSLLEQSKDSYRGKIIDTVNKCISKNDFDSAFSLINQAQEILPSDSDLNSAYNDVFSAYKSSIKARADSHASKGEFDAAFNLISQAQEGFPDDPDLQTTYDSVYSAYQSSVLQQVDTYVAEGQYELALEYINNVQDKYPGDVTFLDSYNSTLATYFTSVRNTAIEQADAYAAENDYANSIKTLREALDIIGQDDVLEANQNMYVISYKDFLKTEAYNVLRSEDYSAAIAVINDGLSTLPNDAELISVIDDLKTYAPMQLFDLECYSGKISYTRKSVKGLNGTTYDNVINVHEYDWWGNSPKTYNASFILDSQYNTVSGTLIWPYDRRNSSSDSSYFSVTFYENDREIYSTPACNADNGEVNFSCNVSNVDILSVKLRIFSGGEDFDAYFSSLTVQK